MPYFKNNGNAIFFELTRSRQKNNPETIVFLHGAGGNSQSWFYQVQNFSLDYNCLVLDQRGFGKSETQAKKVTILNFQEDLLNIINFLEMKKIHLVGQSMGGYSALRLACKTPDRIKSLTLSGSNGMINPGSDKTLRPNFKQIEELSKKGIDWGWSQTTKENKELRKNYDAIRSKNRKILNGSTTFEKSKSDWISIEKLHGINCRTLIIGGNEDPLFSPQLLKKCSKFFKNGHTKILNKCGHSPYLEEPQKFNQALAKHLKIC